MRDKTTVLNTQGEMRMKPAVWCHSTPGGTVVVIVTGGGALW